MDILKTDRAYSCYCGTGEADKFASAFIFEGRSKADPSKVRIAVISDRIVSGYYYNRFEEQFLKRGVKPVLIPVDCEGSAKDLLKVSAVYDYLIDFGFGSRDWIIALGGGGIIDVTGFCASIFEGGINFLAVPTTPSSVFEGVVAQKACLNCKKVKNAVFSSFEPNAVIIDPSYLATVPDRIKHNGYADVIRLGILGNLNILIELVKGDVDREFINRVYALRDRISEASPKLLTLGDELAFAIERYFRFMNYSEGEALALSLLSSVEEKSRMPMIKIYELLNLPTSLEGVSCDSIIKVLKENMGRKGSGKFDIVDMSDHEPRRWVVKTVDADDYLSILRKRLDAVIAAKNPDTGAD